MGSLCGELSSGVHEAWEDNSYLGCIKDQES